MANTAAAALEGKDGSVGSQNISVASSNISNGLGRAYNELIIKTDRLDSAMAMRAIKT